MKLNDTIAAIATPRGSGGIAIIRISGGDSEKIASEIILPYNNKTIFDLESHKLTLCRICEGGDPKYIIDEALVAVMRAPKSYTGETVVEINCHGGYLAADRILRGLLTCGARLAEAGEFTRRAFINGKTTLCEAEAIIDLMNATSDSGLHNAAVSLTGRLGEKITAIRESVLALASHVSAAADYPDEVDPPESAELIQSLSALRGKIKKLLDGFDTGRVLRDGVRTAIVGRPNVGKSSVLNALLRCDRAIVTDIPGTTRDTIEEVISVGGIALRLTDTAGIRSSADEVEKIGIEKSKENIRTADLCLFVIDSSEPITEDDRRIAKAVSKKRTVVLLNKSDKPAAVREDDVYNELNISPEAILKTSALKSENAFGIDDLEETVSEMFVSGKLNSDEVYLSNERQRDSLLKADAAIERAEAELNCGMPYDLLFIDLEDALSALGEITGETVQQEIVDDVFSRFCVGK